MAPAKGKRKIPPSKSRPTKPYKIQKPNDPSIPGGTTSLADRRRRRPTISLASLDNLEDEETHEEAFIGLFSQTSASHATWGKTLALPIAANKKKGRSLAKRRGVQTSFGSFMGYDKTPEPDEPNSPERSILLRFPLEIRERIYGYLLAYPRPILAKYDWKTVESFDMRNHSVIRICKQICDEASKFMYERNTFKALLRTPKSIKHCGETLLINPRFLPFFRNVVIEFHQDNWGDEWYQNACLSIERLVEAETVLETLAIIVTPRYIPAVETKKESRPATVSFMNFFKPNGRLMEAIRQLRCKTLRIMVKLPVSPMTEHFIGPVNLPLEKRREEFDATMRGLIVEMLQQMEEELEPLAHKKREMERRDKKAKSKQTLVEQKIAGLNARLAVLEAIESEANCSDPTIRNRFVFSIDLTYKANGEMVERALTNPEELEFKREQAAKVEMQLVEVGKKIKFIWLNDGWMERQGYCRFLKDDEGIQEA